LRFSIASGVSKRAANSSVEVDAVEWGSDAGEPGQQRRVVGDDRRPDIGLEAAPGAATQAEGSLQARDVGFGAGAEVAQLAIDPVALDHVFDREPALLVECHILYAHGLGLGKVVGAGIATVTSGLARSRALLIDVPFEHRMGSEIRRRVTGILS
jgi:hypothetical protein